MQQLKVFWNLTAAMADSLFVVGEVCMGFLLFVGTVLVTVLWREKEGKWV
jgi:hypothetical protein